jgi:peroxiredoxin
VGDSHARRISYVIDAGGMIAHVFDTVDPKSHPAEVLALL